MLFITLRKSIIRVFSRFEPVFLANEDCLQTKSDPIGRFAFFGRLLFSKFALLIHVLDVQFE